MFTKLFESSKLREKKDFKKGSDSREKGSSKGLFLTRNIEKNTNKTVRISPVRTPGSLKHSCKHRIQKEAK